MQAAPSSAGPWVTFYGAAQAVTGSMHLLEANGQRFLLDCGLVLGHGPDTHERNHRFPFLPSTIDAVLLSHAHVDHCGNLPNLVRQGFHGPIYCTPATRDLLQIMLADSARIQRQEALVSRIVGRASEETTGTLYNAVEVEQTVQQCVPVDYETPVEVGDGVRARFLDAGHLLGSAMIEVTCQSQGATRTITYTGDLGRASLNFLRAPAPLPASDLIISESTYGGRTHQSMEHLTRTLQEVARRTVDRGGKVLVPAFSLGRAQLVAHYLQRWIRLGTLPAVPVYIDSPLAADIAQVHSLYPCHLTDDARSTLPSKVQYVREREESRALSSQRGPCFLVASGGMCEAGRILNHLEQNVDDPRNSIVLVSYQAPGSLGRRLLERGPRVHFRGRSWNKWADVVDLNGFSGHADREDFLKHFRPLLPRRPRIRLVHGEYEQAHALAGALRAVGFDEVDIPRRADRVLVA
jgi:metallo-beta-lactamase family protein